MHNATYDAGWLRAEGVEVQGRIIDTMIAAPLIDENRFSYSLNNLGRDYIDMRKDEKMLRAAAKDWGIDPKKDMWRLPASYVGAYAEQDAMMTLKLWDRLKVEISSQDLTHIFNLETSLIPLMVEMRARGVRVDLDKAEIARKGLRSKVQDIKTFIKDKTGVAIEPWAAASVQQVFEALNLQYPKTEAGAPSFTKQYLNTHPHEVCQAIVRLREFDKADSTFIDSILRHEHKGRIHTEFHQLRSDDGGTVTGRFSSSSPNLQQIPARDPDIKRLIRGLFVPEEGQMWGSFDYSSQEPRLLVHFAASMPDHMRGPVVDSFVEGYQDDNFDFHQMVAEIAGIKRKEAKTCIAEGELVLTDKGLIPIERITLDHLVWDGAEWVRHEGLVYQGVKEVMTYDGLTATADHEVWVGRERSLPFGVAASRLERLARTGVGERPVRLVDDHYTSFAEPAAEVVGYLSAVQQPQGSLLQKLWGKRGSMLFSIGQSVGRPPVFASFSGGLDGVRHRSNGQQWALRGGKHTSSHEVSKPSKQARVYDIKNAGPRHRFTVSGVLVHNCGLGIMYGMGVGKLAAQLSISTEEGKELMETFNTRVPFVKQLATVASQRAESHGQIRTILGRLCRFHLWEPKTFGYNKPLPLEEAKKEYGSVGNNLRRAYTYKALNKLIQGSAADQTKKAMADCYAAGLIPLLTVHDELCFSVEGEEQAAQIKEIMETGLPLKIPSKVDVDVPALRGQPNNWGEVE
jgi:DNA polymerase I-like protein with 3'-5' exonuclease and polymerase domains